ncbi:FMN-dependent NADH-azoreductase [Actinokineospora diospyrosa]|uniref:FMN dependent NADH:quinone oxidoreductase n=1 Tax=Actinokineospora diospyrosa TaxID=103728 RepID=A0ABT1I6J1_9PSEU|nr:NAD(P)H-dependent oxidoreductase [Actinokineospora diospyrosa]MCP2268218.1 FMN-dependent NADH-azoreductase [Actinokineospora diospyrosa]
MNLFRLDSSIRVAGSVSRAVADTVTENWLAAHPNGTVTRRDLVADELPPTAWTDSLAAATTPADQRTPTHLGALSLASTIADEVAAADSLVIATSLYNFGISQHLKAWIDLLITDPRFAPGTQPLVGKQAALIIARGGGYGAGTPREGWDHATPWLIRIFQDVLGAEVTFVAAELTLATTVPSMAELIPLAQESATAAHDLAATTGRAFATKLPV